MQHPGPVINLASLAVFLLICAMILGFVSLPWVLAAISPVVGLLITVGVYRAAGRREPSWVRWCLATVWAGYDPTKPHLNPIVTIIVAATIVGMVVGFDVFRALPVYVQLPAALLVIGFVLKLVLLCGRREEPGWIRPLLRLYG